MPTTTTLVPLATFREACISGEVAQIRRWTALGRLPRLTAHEATQKLFKPLSKLIVMRHVPDVLKWLILESGYRVDITLDNNAAMSWALANSGTSHLADWYLFQSQQLAKILSKPDKSWVEQLPADSQERLRRAIRVNHFLRRCRVPQEQREKYLLSDLVYNVVATNLLQSAADLERLITTPAGPRATKL